MDQVFFEKEKAPLGDTEQKCIFFSFYVFYTFFLTVKPTNIKFSNSINLYWIISAENVIENTDFE